MKRHCADVSGVAVPPPRRHPPAAAAQVALFRLERIQPPNTRISFARADVKTAAPDRYSNTVMAPRTQLFVAIALLPVELRKAMTGCQPAQCIEGTV